MAFQDMSASFAGNDVPTSTAKLLQAIIQPSPTSEAGHSTKALAAEQTTAIIRALTMASLEQFYNVNRWTALDQDTANKEREMYDSVRGVLQFALGGEIERTPGLLVQKFAEETTFEGLFSRAQRPVSPSGTGQAPDAAVLEEELCIWLLVRLVYCAALIRNAPAEQLPADRWQTRLDFVHRLEGYSRLVHNYLFCSTEHEMRESKLGRAQEFGKLWVTLAEELRAMLMGWAESTDLDVKKEELGCIQLLGVDRRTQVPFAEGQTPHLQLDRRPFTMPICSKSFAVNLLLTSLRIHLSIIHHSAFFIDTISSAVEALITLWGYTMKDYPTSHNPKVLVDLVELLGWFFEDRSGPLDLLASADAGEDFNYLSGFIKNTSSLSLDKICSTVIDQARKLFLPHGTRTEPDGSSSHDLILLLLKIWRWLGDADGRITMTKTSRSITHLIVRYGEQMVEYLLSHNGSDTDSPGREMQLLCLLFLCCPIDVQSGRVRYECRPHGTYASFQLLDPVLISQVERFLSDFTPSFVQQITDPKESTPTARTLHWLADVLNQICARLAISAREPPRRKRKRPDIEIIDLENDEGDCTLRVASRTSACTDHRKEDFVGSKTSLSTNTHANILALLKGVSSFKESSPCFKEEHLHAFLINYVKELPSQIQLSAPENTQSAQMRTEATERELDLMSSVICNFSSKLTKPLTSAVPHDLCLLPSGDLKDLFSCPDCDDFNTFTKIDTKQQWKVFPLHIFRSAVMICHTSGLLNKALPSNTIHDDEEKIRQQIEFRRRLALVRFLTRLLNHTIMDATNFDDPQNSPIVCGADVSMGFLLLLEQASRMERIASGRMIVNIMSNSLHMLSLSPTNKLSDCQLEPVLNKLEALIEDGSLRIQETLTITILHGFESTRLQDLALIDDGRVDLNGCVSYRLCRMLLRQMCRRSSYLLGVIRTQMASLSKRNDASAYNLLARYLPSLSQVMVVELKFDSCGASLLADLLGISTNAFLSQTAGYTVPHLVLNSQTTMIEAIARAKEESVPQLLVNQAAEIITQLCLQSTFEKLEIGLTNFSKLLNVGRENSMMEDQPIIEVGALLQVCAGLVYFRLIAEAAEEINWRQRLNNVKLALWNALQLKQSRPTWNRAPCDKELQKELKAHTLPILSHINAALQDMRGKISMAEKIKVIQGLGDLLRLVDSGVSSYMPQIMTTLQASLTIPALRSSTLQTWNLFVKVIPLKDLKPFVGQITAALVGIWNQMTGDQFGLSIRILHHIVTQRQHLDHYAFDIADVSSLSIPARISADPTQMEQLLTFINQQYRNLTASLSHTDKIKNLVGRINSESEIVIRQSLKELIATLEVDPDKTKVLITGDTFHPLVGDIVKALIGVTARCNDASDDLKSLAFECLGTIGAVDPDRCEIRDEGKQMVLASNFSDHDEAVNFALHLLKDELVGAYRSTNDSKHHGFLTYAIQELLRFCGFTTDLIDPAPAQAPSSAVKKRWKSMPKHVLDSISPLLGSKFKLSSANHKTCSVPIYENTSIYSSWLQKWLLRLIPLIQNQAASDIFRPFLGIIRHGDTVISQKLLPHVALHIIISGSPEELDNIKLEIITVLEDQVECCSDFSPEGRQLVAQTIFGLIDHFSRWVRDRHKGQASLTGAAVFKRKDSSSIPDAATARVHSIVAEVSQELIASAALYCKDHARALLNFEQQILQLEGANGSTIQSLAGEADRDLPPQDQLQKYYEKAHEIYAAIDEPDGMEGISAKITAPSILHQIREHESTGRWTSAQSCWEVELQRQPDELRSHLGLLRCLRNLGHYDSLRAHIVGVLQSHPSWEGELAPFSVESSLVSNDWQGLTRAVQVGSADSPEVIFGRVVDTLLNSDQLAFDEAMKDARIRLGNQILGASRKDAYRRMYDSAIYLHILHEVPLIDLACRAFSSTQAIRLGQPGLTTASPLMKRLESRLESISPGFRYREQVLRLRRATFQLRSRGAPAVGQLWVQTAKIARKAGHLQTSYSAVLQALELKAPTAFMQKAKLMKLEDQPYKAIVELDDNLKLHPVPEKGKLREICTRDYAKAALQRVRWMDEVDRYSVNCIVGHFEKLCQEHPDWASPFYYLGRFYDEKASQALTNTRVPFSTSRVTAAEYTYHCCRNFHKSLSFGTKFIYQALPRMLTMYFTLGEHPDLVKIFKTVEKKKRGNSIRQDHYTGALEADELGAVFVKLDRSMHSAIRKLPVFEWLTVLPQVVSRVMHKSTHVQTIVHKLLVIVLRSYPDQALWAMVSGVESSNAARSRRCTFVLNDAKDYVNTTVAPSVPPQISSQSLTTKIEQCRKLVEQFLKLCNHSVKKDAQYLYVHETFPTLQECAPCDLIIPFQYSLIASLPPHDVNFALHQPFPSNLPCILGFKDKITIMSSLIKPRKIGIYGSDGQEYPFLCKPKDDLRKDARLMEFNSMINKLLKRDSESRKRNLHIRTYAVVVLNEECGLLEWVPNTIPFRNILIPLYADRGIPLWNVEIKAVSDKIRKHRDEWDKVKQIFEREILTRFPSLFHHWFLNNFPDPNSWLRSRQAYGRTCAVMSMVGFVLGLGDRHGENILLDATTGDTVHVDFNCLFDKGRTFEVSENVPFRLTHNMVAGLGVTGVEGVFRRACEVTMGILRNNKDSLMSVLETFVHDPLVDWMPSGSKRKVDAPTEEYVVKEAKRCLEPISRKLTGYQVNLSVSGKTDRQMSTENQVDSLINEARDNRNLGRMYFGWAPFL